MVSKLESRQSDFDWACFQEISESDWKPGLSLPGFFPDKELESGVSHKSVLASPF